MYTPEALLDMHTRGHRSFAWLLEYCSPFSDAEFQREVPGFGFPSLQLQAFHIVQAEDFWIGVLRGLEEEMHSPASYPDILSLEAFRARVQSVTAGYLGSSDTAGLSTRRAFRVDDGEEMLVPAHVLLRTLTHLYHHYGQMLAICRILGRPCPQGLDFPLD